jgi:hypothetical protein
MNSVVIRHGAAFCRGIVAVLLLSAVSLRADPIIPGEGSIFETDTVFKLSLAFLAEAGCVLLMLRRWRTPRLFILWIMGMHVFTYPLFLTLLWLAQGMRPAMAAGIGEGLIVLIEGVVIYLICRYAPFGKPGLPFPSVSKSLFASLAGNICSAAVFPFLVLFMR